MFLRLTLFFVSILLMVSFNNCSPINYQVESITNLSSEVPNGSSPINEDDDSQIPTGNIIPVSNSPYNNPTECDRYLDLKPFPTKLYSINNNALYVDKDHPNASDNNDGIYKKYGGTGPFKTITKLLSVLSEGQTGYIRSSQTPYSETGTNIDSRTGIQVLKSGTPEAPITISGYPGERPVISGTGLTIISQSHINIQNLEFFDISGSAIYTGNIGEGYTVSEIHIKDVFIHYVFGGDNIGGVRFDDCESCTLKNSVVKNTYDIRSTATGAQPNEPYPFHAGVHGYRPKAVTIKNNIICNTKRGIYQKHPNANGLRSHHVISNVFINVTAALSLEMAGVPKITAEGDLPPPYVAKDIVFSYNLVVDSGGMVNTILHETSLQSSGLDIYNNTAYNARVVYYGSGLKDINSFNNILYGTQGARPYSIVNKSVNPVNPAYNYPHEYFFEGQFNYIDHNLYYDIDQLAHLGRYGDSQNEHLITNLSQWQTAFTDTSSKYLSSNPDQNSSVEDPAFSDPANFDFSPTNIKIGRGGLWDSSLGAFTKTHTPGFK